MLHYPMYMLVEMLPAFAKLFKNCLGFCSHEHACKTHDLTTSSHPNALIIESTTLRLRTGGGCGWQIWRFVSKLRFQLTTSRSWIYWLYHLLMPPP